MTRLELYASLDFVPNVGTTTFFQAAVVLGVANVSLGLFNALFGVMLV